MNKKWLAKYVQLQQALLSATDLVQVERFCEKLRLHRNSGRNIWVFGNGGSAANCAHFVTDLSKIGGFRAFDLSSNSALLTMISNDYGYENCFKRQIQDLGTKDDIAVGLSVSGQSRNVLCALSQARDLGLTTVFIHGRQTEMIEDARSILIHIGTEHFGRAEDAMMTILHMCAYAFFEEAAWKE